MGHHLQGMSTAGQLAACRTKDDEKILVRDCLSRLVV